MRCIIQILIDSLPRTPPCAGNGDPKKCIWILRSFHRFFETFNQGTVIFLGYSDKSCGAVDPKIEFLEQHISANVSLMRAPYARILAAIPPLLAGVKGFSDDIAARAVAAEAFNSASL